MGVVVLHPQDCLRNPFAKQYATPPSVKAHKKANPNLSHNRSSITERTESTRNRRRRSPEKSQKSSASFSAPAPKNLVMGQVKILRRGEEIPKPVPDRRSEDVGLGTMGRLGPDPELMGSQVRVMSNGVESEPFGFYAGSAFVSSPPPSSVPLPAFFTRRTLTLSVDHNQDEATTDLRRLLGLN